MQHVKKVTMILFAITLAGCEPVVVNLPPEPLCFARAASIAWLLANGERGFVIALDAKNTVAGGC